MTNLPVPPLGLQQLSIEAEVFPVSSEIPENSQLLALAQKLDKIMQETTKKQQMLLENQNILKDWIAENVKPIATVSDGSNVLSVHANGIINVDAPRPKPKLPPTVNVPGDYSKVKAPSNQIPITQFITYCDQYFRPLTVLDLNYLEKPAEFAPYSIIPPIGTHYKEQWEQEDAALHSLFDSGISNPAGLNREYVEIDDVIIPGEVSLGNVTERLVSCLVPDGLAPDLKTGLDDDSIKLNPVMRTKSENFVSEERLKAELINVGLLDASDSIDPESDEICVSLRNAQAELKAVMTKNAERRKTLYDTAVHVMGYQEYKSILDEINRNIEQSYMKRIKPPNSKSKVKKRPAEPRIVSQAVLLAIQNRKRFIEEVGQYFPPDKA